MLARLSVRFGGAGRARGVGGLLGRCHAILGARPVVGSAPACSGVCTCPAAVPAASAERAASAFAAFTLAAAVPESLPLRGRSPCPLEACLLALEQVGHGQVVLREGPQEDVHRQLKLVLDDTEQLLNASEVELVAGDRARERDELCKPTSPPLSMHKRTARYFHSPVGAAAPAAVLPRPPSPTRWKTPCAIGGARASPAEIAAAVVGALASNLEYQLVPIDGDELRLYAVALRLEPPALRAEASGALTAKLLNCACTSRRARPCTWRGRAQPHAARRTRAPTRRARP